MEYLYNITAWNGSPETHKRKYSIKLLYYLQQKHKNSRHHTAKTVQRCIPGDPSTIFLATCFTYMYSSFFVHETCGITFLP